MKRKMTTQEMVRKCFCHGRCAGQNNEDECTVACVAYDELDAARAARKFVRMENQQKNDGNFARLIKIVASKTPEQIEKEASKYPVSKSMRRRWKIQGKK
ncbi:hypothetical protein ACFLQL_00420 [Verrucomicrobiota bacterium]